MLNFAKIFVFILMHSSISAWANNTIYDRFKISKKNESYLLTTESKSTDGLGQMLRQLNLQPNWSNRGWIKDIYAMNSDSINVRGDIVQYGKQIKIPLAALRDCDGYFDLKNKVESTYNSHSQQNVKITKESQPNEVLHIPGSSIADTLPDLFDPETPKVDSAKKVQQDDVILDKALPTKKDLKTNPIINKKTLSHWAPTIWAGLGWSNAYNEDPPSSTITDLNTNIAFQLGGRLGYHFANKVYSAIYLNAEHKKYEDPSNLIVNHESEFFLTYGLQLGFKQTSYSVGLFIENSQTPRTQLNSSTHIELSNESLLKVGAQFLLPINLKTSLLTVSASPYFINEFKIDEADYDSGFGANIELKYYISNSNFHTGLNFRYEKQDYDNIENTLSEAFLTLGYKHF